MEESPKHLLTELGVLTSFSIAKKIQYDKIKQLKDQIGKVTDDEKTAEELLKKAVIKDTANSLKKIVIPGIIKETKSNIRAEEDKRLMEYTFLSSIVSKKILERKIDKYHQCYIINVLVNMLGLDEDDFTKFHRIFEKYKEGSIESPENIDDDENSYPF